MEFIYQPVAADRIGDYLMRNFAEPWTDFRAAIAFVKRSGTRRVAAPLAAFAQRSNVEIVVGIDHGGTSFEGLRHLLTIVEPNGRLMVFHNLRPSTFHPKIYLFKSPNAADIVVGSGNLTEGGLFTNYEAAFRIVLDLDRPEQARMLASVEKALDEWADTSSGVSAVLDAEFLARLAAWGFVTPEKHTASPPEPKPPAAGGARLAGSPAPFAYRDVRPAPPIPKREKTQPYPEDATGGEETAGGRAGPFPSGPSGFVMTLQRTDVGFGRTGPGTSRRSPELFIPLAARDANPAFWGWPGGFSVLDPARHPDKRDRQGVRMYIGGKIVAVNMMTWPLKHDFRLRSEALRSAGRVGDILRMEKADPGSGYDYYVEIIPGGSTQYPVFDALCRHTVRNSRKRYGYY